MYPVALSGPRSGSRDGSLERHLPTTVARAEPPQPCTPRAALGHSSTRYPRPRRSVLSVLVAICAPTVLTLRCYCSCHYSSRYRSLLISLVIIVLPGHTSDVPDLLQASPCPALGSDLVICRSGALGAGQGPRNRSIPTAGHLEAGSVNREEAGSSIVIISREVSWGW